MDTYSILREFADSWALLAMMAFFIGAILLLFRPGAKQQHIDAANIPFNEEQYKDSSTSNKRSKSNKKLEV